MARWLSKPKEVSGRRNVDFSSYQDILDDVRSLASRPTRQLGNWSLGEICEHLASAMNMAVDGPPVQALVAYSHGRTTDQEALFCRDHSSPASSCQATPRRSCPSGADTDKGITALARAIERIQRTADRKPHPIFGRMTNEEWDRMQFLHSAMHLSFIVTE